MPKPVRVILLKRFAEKTRNQGTAAGQGAGGVFSVPAPTLGLNTRNDYGELAANEARDLVNWLPDIGACKVRPGYQSHSTLAASVDVQGLIEYKGLSGRKLIATAGGEVHDTTSTSPSVLTASAAYTNNRWRMANFNAYLIAVNGVDTPWTYNGTAVGASGFSGSGLTLTNLVNVAVARNRLWFCENSKADVWYGGIGAITGTLTKFQLSQIADGGFCMAIGSWSKDAGDGSDDYVVFVMDTGQAVIYQGDPATSFSLVGKFTLPEPVGRGCLLKMGGELIVMTKQGPIPISTSFTGIAFDQNAIGPWGKIAPSWKQDFDTYGSGNSWSTLFANGIAYFSFPTSSASNASKQYVFNTRRSAWTTYEGLPASAWATLNGDVYLGAFLAGKVNKHQGGQDNGVAIVARGRPGFTYPVGVSRSIAINGIKPNIDADGSLQGNFVVDADFAESAFPSSLLTFTSVATGAQWGDPWGTDWQGASRTIKRWYGARAYGRAIAPCLQVYSSATNALWYATDVMGIPSGPL